MPGLIDVHVHLTFSALGMAELLSLGLTPESAEAAAARKSESMLLRGFNMGGPVLVRKAGIDAERDVWLSTQPLRASMPEMDPSRLEKRKPVMEGQARMWPLARELGVGIAWGTDFLLEPAEILRMPTQDNAELLALSGPRNPYPGRARRGRGRCSGRPAAGRRQSLEQFESLVDPERWLLLIMKDGRTVKDRTGTD